MKSYGELKLNPSNNLPQCIVDRNGKKEMQSLYSSYNLKIEVIQMLNVIFFMGKSVKYNILVFCFLTCSLMLYPLVYDSLAKLTWP